MDVSDKRKQECKIAIALLRDFVKNHEFGHVEVTEVKIRQWTGLDMFPTLLRPVNEEMEVTETVTPPRMTRQRRRIEELNSDGALQMVCTISLSSNHRKINDVSMEISDHSTIPRLGPTNDLVLLAQGILRHLEKALESEARLDDDMQEGFQVLADFLHLCGFFDEVQKLVTAVVAVVGSFFHQTVIKELSTLPENAYWHVISIFTSCPSVAHALLRVISVRIPEIVREFRSDRNFVNEMSFDCLDTFHYWLQLLDACLETLRQSPVDKWQSRVEEIVTNLSTMSVTRSLNVALALLNMLEKMKGSLPLG